LNKYSRIFHHISPQDVKRNLKEKIDMEKIKENIKLLEEERKIFIKRESESIKSNWRDDLTEV